MHSKYLLKDHLMNRHRFVIMFICVSLNIEFGLIFGCQVAYER